MVGVLYLPCPLHIFYYLDVTLLVELIEITDGVPVVHAQTVFVEGQNGANQHPQAVPEYQSSNILQLLF